jgi:hypothetical protein
MTSQRGARIQAAIVDDDHLKNQGVNLCLGAAVRGVVTEHYSETGLAKRRDPPSI